MCSTAEFPAIVLAIASQPRGGGSGVAVFAFSAACLRSAEAAHVRRCRQLPSQRPRFFSLINTLLSHFFKMPSINPAFPCSATCDPSTPGGVLLRHFTVTSPSADAPLESTVSLILTMLPLHDMTASIKKETVFSVSTNREVWPSSYFYSFPRCCIVDVALQVMVAATAAHGGGCLHALAFSDGEAQVLTASGSVAASSHVFERSAP